MLFYGQLIELVEIIYCMFVSTSRQLIPGHRQHPQCRAALRHLPPSGQRQRGAPLARAGGVLLAHAGFTGPPGQPPLLPGGRRPPRQAGALHRRHPALLPGAGPAEGARRQDQAAERLPASQRPVFSWKSCRGRQQQKTGHRRHRASQDSGGVLHWSAAACHRR